MSASESPRLLALRLAAEADCDVRTSARALREGADRIRTLSVRERVITAAHRLGIRLPTAAA